MAQTPKKPLQPKQTSTEQPRMTRRASARSRRERRRQRLIIIISGVAIGLALLAVLTGILYEQVWIPSRPIARAGGATLTRGGYWTERKYQLTRDILSNLQLLKLFGSQLAGQLQGQIPNADGQVKTIRTAPVDETTVDGWIKRQVIVSGANTLGIQANDGEIAQKLTTDLGKAFPSPPSITATASLTPTTALSRTSSTTATTTASQTALPTTNSTAATSPTSAKAITTATASVSTTTTPKPTQTPAPTLSPEAAAQEQERVIGRAYDAYVAQLKQTDPQLRANLTLDDFKGATHDQYLEQVLTSKVEEKLVPETGFQPNTDPSSLEVRQILIKVTVPISATQAQREAAYAARRPAAEAILQQLHNGADFATLAKQKSEDVSTRDTGGTLPSFDKTGKTPSDTQIDPAIVKAALALKENGISDLIQTSFGWHIIQLTQRTIPSKEDQLTKARSDAFDKWVEQQRAAASVEHFPPQTPSPIPSPTKPVPLPTAPLGGEPTKVPTNTTTLTNTTALTNTAPLAGTLTTEAAPTGTTPQTPSLPSTETTTTGIAPAGTSVLAPTGTP